MNFRTEISLAKSEMKISYKDPVMFMGSCFSDYIGSKLSDLCFPVCINPFGVVYNPFSVTRSLKFITEAKEFQADDLFYYNDLWHSWDHHSSLSGSNKEETLQKINESLVDAGSFLKKAKYLIITFGTARIYRLKKSEKPVSNCHKYPASEFYRELLGVSEVVSDFLNIREKLLEFNPDLKIIFTVSPVRHWKDGAHGNQVSKSVLHLAIHNLLQINSCGCEYFPSYELLLDDLRDYRFFADDYLHPNDLAVNYIWEKFRDHYMDDETISLSGEINRIVKASRHRLFNPGSDSSVNFLKSQLMRIEELKEKHPYLELSELQENFSNRLNIH